MPPGLSRSDRWTWLARQDERRLEAALRAAYPEAGPVWLTFKLPETPQLLARKPEHLQAHVAGIEQRRAQLAARP